MNTGRLTNSTAALVVIDPQERLLAAMPRRDTLTNSLGKLIQAARVLELPTLVTLQYVKGLGPVGSELAEAVHGLPTLEKMSFSCCGHEPFQQALAQLHRPQVILAGVETHVCVQQTALDLIAAGQEVHLCADAVSSRRDLDRDIALARLRDAGAFIGTVESVIFDILRAAGTAPFKACLPLFK